MEHAAILPLLAVILDLCLGDPPSWPHPVRWIGWIARKMEAVGRLLYGDAPSRAFGTSAAILLLLLVSVAYGLISLLPVLGILAAVYLAYAGLALGCLLRETRHVSTLLDQGDLLAARAALAMLVSRDTSGMDETECRRSLAETLSENFNDGFVAPFFWLCIFGPAGLWMYKTISTLDSMWGYRTPRYACLGWFAARTDDLLAWVPARFSFAFMLICGMISGMDWRAALRQGPQQARSMESPNAGWPMAAAAWLCGGSMGGATVYFGEVKQKPQLGPAGQSWSASRLHTLQRLVFWSALCLVAVAQAILWAV
ncbi:MAG: adenosylcobinamide-phosphate synthase CbiB [Desulfovibrio sp.]|jgi:adenosylcobinamide-phosphate synthase|nr:adenosylcobinamide-phosphate synthase CbiB [Desulfovibrio sp.]